VGGGGERIHIWAYFYVVSDVLVGNNFRLKGVIKR
jgi:hypothetical protein